MSEKIYFCLLIVCGIWSQGIIEIFANEEIQDSSNFLVREKRVISRVPGEDVPISITNAPYAVIIKQARYTSRVGSILSNNVVITAASYVTESPEHYQITSGQTASTRSVDNNVIEIRRHLGIALLIVSHPFVFSEKCFYIKLHEGPLVPGMVATISGWGFNSRCNERGTNHSVKLRSIQVPIIPHRECVNWYRNYLQISETEVCTYDPQRHCGHSDFGAGLVIDGHLAGVHTMTGPEAHRINPEFPAVFAVLQDVSYNNWIRTNLRNISAEFRNRQHPLFPHRS